MNALGLVFALLIGLSLGMLGGGGSILTVPVFAYVLGYPPKTAIAMTLPVVAISSAVGVIGHWRAGRVRLGLALQFGAAAMLTAFVVARLTPGVPARVQLMVLGVAIVAAAISMLRPATAHPVVPGAPRPVWLVMSAGAVVGALTGLTGVGGGFLIVPALVGLARLPMKEAVGTSLLIIVMSTISGFLGYSGTVRIDWVTLAPFIVVAVMGIVVGTRLVTRVPAAQLRRGFALLLVVVGVLVLWQSGLA